MAKFPEVKSGILSFLKIRKKIRRFNGFLGERIGNDERYFEKMDKNNQKIARCIDRLSFGDRYVRYIVRDYF